MEQMRHDCYDVCVSRPRFSREQGITVSLTSKASSRIVRDGWSNVQSLLLYGGETWENDTIHQCPHARRRRGRSRDT